MKLAAIDLGSGTIKLSAFEKQGNFWKPITLEELNTELRRGMGPERRLQEEPIADTLKACELFLKKAKELGISRMPAYATSAVRKAANPEALLKPLEHLGISTRVLSEEEEGQLNLLGLLANGGTPDCVVIDPGGDSTDCAWLGRGQVSKAQPDWHKAETLSLPFGSVSLLEKYGRTDKTKPIPKHVLQVLILQTCSLLEEMEGAKALRRLRPAIRMNAPIAKALAKIAGRDEAEVPRQASLDDLRNLLYLMAGQTHQERAKLIEGEPMGKVDRTPYGFASWIAILEFMHADYFLIEPYGIKLGAAIYLNQTPY